MTGGKIEYHTKVVFTLKALADASSITVSVSNIPEYTVTDEVWPILKQVGSVGSQMGEFMPSTNTSSIVLKNGPSSLGFERRFSDLLERYSIINQQVLVYVAASAIGSFTSADYELRWAGTVKRHRMRGSEFIVEIAGQGIQDRVLNTIITADMSTDVPSGSLGYALPIVFGQDVQVRPLPISVGVLAEQGDYAYATNMNTFVCQGIQSIFAKGYTDEYFEVQSSPTYTTELFGSSYNAGKSNAAWSANTEYAHRFAIPDPGYIAFAAHVYVYKAAGVAAGDLEIAIQVDDYLQQGSSANWGRAPGTVLARGNYQLDQLNAAAGAYKIKVAFDKHAVLKPSQNWFLTYRLKNETTGKIGVYYDAGITEAQFYKTTDGTLWREDASANRRYWGIYAIEINDNDPYGSSADNDTAWFQVLQDSTLPELPDFRQLSFVLGVNGLCDDSSGIVTGTPSQLIESPQHAVELITKQFNGTTYTGGQFGSEHSSTWGQVNTSTSRFYRKLKGKTEGATKLSQFLEQICRDTASRITMHPSASTPMGYWAWGAEASVSDYLGPDDFTVLEHEVMGTETIVNSLEMFYDQRIASLDYVTGSALGEFRNYAGRFYSRDSSAQGYAECENVSAVSRSVFGVRALEIRSRQWIGDSQSARNLALSILRRNAVPAQYVDIEVPYLRFKDRKMLDVVHIASPELPAFFGTTPKASKPVMTGSGVEVDVTTGFNFMRAAGYRAQIEGLTTIFDAENTPRIRATVRILNNPKDVT